MVDRSWLFCLLLLNQAIRSMGSDMKPNIVFIMADDLGWGNVGYHNQNTAEIKTPAIDQLVSEGLELDRHYTYSSCTPSRASFHTGRLPVHVQMNGGDPLTDSTHGIPVNMTGFATKLQEGGYNTHLVGKWDGGFSSYDKLPTSKGYDSFYGYLGKSVKYFTKYYDDDCSEDVVDFWEDDHPMNGIDYLGDTDDLYVEYLFRNRVQDIISDYGESDEDDPFFLMYSMHLPHYPAQITEDNLEYFGNDINDCATETDYVYPGYDRETYGDEFQCRSIAQSQVNLMDTIVGEVVDNLKAQNLWDDTLLIFASDNGGSLELTKTALNNWPLRGGKSSNFEGGTRTVAFVSGGYLPESRRGQKEEGLTHLADWYSTFCTLAGVDSTDYVASAAGLPAIDSLDLWPMINGTVTESPRSDLVLDMKTYISGKYKIHLDDVPTSILMEELWPNPTSPNESVIEESIMECSITSPCLFDIYSDPSESNNLREVLPNVTLTMKKTYLEMEDDFWTNDIEGEDSCPDTADLSDTSCGCWMALNHYNGFVGPYQDMPDKMYWNVQTQEQFNVAGMWNSNHFGLQIKHYILLLVATVMMCILAAVYAPYLKALQRDKNIGNDGYGAVGRLEL